jgi:multicomponent Na+:H+ antiporter subunit G
MNMASQILMLIGAFFMFVAAMGVFRMPDLYMRLHANTKSATFGVGFLLLGAATHFEWDFTISIRALAIVLFLFATAPVAAHMLGRAAYIAGAPLWEGTLSDDLEGQYNLKTHELATQSTASKSNTKKTGDKQTT